MIQANMLYEMEFNGSLLLAFVWTLCYQKGCFYKFKTFKVLCFFMLIRVEIEKINQILDRKFLIRCKSYFLDHTQNLHPLFCMHLLITWLQKVTKNELSLDLVQTLRWILHILNMIDSDCKIFYKILLYVAG